MKPTDGFEEGATVKLTGSNSWPNLVTTIARVKRDKWGSPNVIFVDVGRDDGPAAFRPWDLELVTTQAKERG